MHELTIAEAGARIAAGQLSPVTLTEHILERIDRLNGKLNAFIRVTAEQALGEARQAEAEIKAGALRGLLHGIPIAVKDIFDMAGVPTTANSKLLLDNVPTEDGAAVRRLREAGAVLLGKLTTHEFALWGPSFDLPFPPARNPWNTDYNPGGSSSGAGAGVVAGLCLGALCSDTGGSIRSPASYCGAAGLKPSYGLVSRRGMIPLAPSLDHSGPMARTVEDCAILLQAIAERDAERDAVADRPVADFRAALTGDIRGIRIGVVREFRAQGVAPDLSAAIDAALDVQRDLGAVLSDVTLSPLADYHACGLTIMLAESFAIHANDLRARLGDYGAYVRDYMPLGALLTAADYIQAMRRRRELCSELAAVFRDVDVLVMPNHPSTAPLIADVDKSKYLIGPFRGMPFNLSGGPALSVCIGYNSEGLPFSLQIAGKPFDDATVLRVGHAYERSVPWCERRPAL